MDRVTLNFYFLAFDKQLDIMPGFPLAKKLVKDIQSKVPKAITETLTTDTMLATLEAFSQKNQFADYVDAMHKWVATVVDKIAKLPDNVFEVRRGKDSSKTQVALFGKTQSLADHSMGLLKGSKLADIMLNGPGNDFTDWTNLNAVVNFIRSAIVEVVPTDKRATKPRKTLDEQLTDAKAKLEKTREAGKEKAQTKVNELEKRVADRDALIAAQAA